MWSCVSLSLRSLQAPVGFMASAVPWRFCWISEYFLQGSRPTVRKILPSYLPKSLSPGYLSKHLVIQALCHPFLSGSESDDAGWFIAKVVPCVKKHEMLPQNPATNCLLPTSLLAQWQWALLLLFANVPSLRSLDVLCRSRAQRVLRGHILSSGFWYISIIFHSFG